MVTYIGLPVAAQYTNMVMSIAVHTTAEKMGTTQYDSPSMLTECLQTVS